MLNMTVIRLFFIVNICGVLIYTYTVFLSSKVHNTIPAIETGMTLKYKYILYWTAKPSYPLETLSTGQFTFVNYSCDYNNCFITTNKTFFGEHFTNFDAILFNSKDLTVWEPDSFPKNRSANQKYIFVSKELPNAYPICDDRANSFFNWTWTYRLDSDIINPFFEIRDDNETVIAPRENVTWIENDEFVEIPASLSYQLKSKFRAVIWFTSDCHKDYPHAEYVKELQLRLKKYKLYLDIYGPCGTRECPNNSLKECYEMIESDYFYQISFEKKESVDYVAEALTAMNNLAVPIVFGNYYNKFLPVGSYLNAQSMSVNDLADFIMISIRQRNIYIKFFKWHNSYTLKKAEDLTGICELCKRLNENEITMQSPKYVNFLEWWHSSSHYLKVRCNK